MTGVTVSSGLSAFSFVFGVHVTALQGSFWEWPFYNSCHHTLLPLVPVNDTGDLAPTSSPKPSTHLFIDHAPLLEGTAVSFSPPVLAHPHLWSLGLEVSCLWKPFVRCLKWGRNSPDCCHSSLYFSLSSFYLTMLWMPIYSDLVPVGSLRVRTMHWSFFLFKLSSSSTTPAM